MEQAVWVYFGVVTVLLSFGIIGKLVMDHKKLQTDDFFDKSLSTLANECNFVCDSTNGARLSTDVDFASGLLLFTNSNKICGKYKDQYKCVNCNCGLTGYTLDLNTSIAKKTFILHTYKCIFTKSGNGIEMECKG